MVFASLLTIHAELSAILEGDERARKMTVMGGAALRFFGMNIYTVGLYIDTELAVKSPELQRFRGMDARELRNNESFYAAMMSKVDHYDRALWIKLSIPLKGSLVKKNLEVRLIYWTKKRKGEGDRWRCLQSVGIE